MRRRYKIAIYLAAVFVLSWIPFGRAGGATGALTGLMVVAGIVGGLIWALRIDRPVSR